MYAFLNHRSSCYLDSVLVAMFLTHQNFQDALHVSTSSSSPLVRAVSDEITRLHSLKPRGWICNDVRRHMGAPWNTNTPQSCVDCFHALLDGMRVSSLGTLTHTITYLAHNTTRRETHTSDVEEFRVQLAVAGQHTSLENVFEPQGTILPNHAESFATIHTIQLEQHSSVLVFEVARCDTCIQKVEYGVTSSPMLRVVMVVQDVEWTLIGVVCRTGNHYVAFVWHDEAGWGFYDDAHNQGAVVECDHPEVTHAPPSRFGELFFYGETSKLRGIDPLKYEKKT